MLALGFAAAVTALLVLSRRNLALGLLAAALGLGVFSLSPASFGLALWHTVSDPSVLLLAGIVFTIPLIAGTLEVSGQMANLVDQLRVGVRTFLMLSPALLGLMPMPGGALLSAPLVERGAGHVPADVKAAANVWFRHILLLVYPLSSSLIASAKVAGLNVYATLPYLVIPFLGFLAVGSAFLLARVRGERVSRRPFSLRELALPVTILLAAPLIDLLVSTFVRLPAREISTAVGVVASLLLALRVGRVRIPALRAIVLQAKPWTYAAIVLAMFAFLNVFAASGAPAWIAGMRLPPLALCVGGGLALGWITGRIEAPMAVILPIYVASAGSVSLPAFAVTYSAAFLGYVATPVHPCVSVSIAYFGTSMGAFLRRVAPPTAIAAAATAIVGLFVL
ncbi:MAG: DUF401 family protein [Candidatus Bipolaricaulota bacterium]